MMKSTMTRRPISASISPATLLALVFFGMLFLGMIAITEKVFTSQFPGTNDFLSRWEPARGFWLEGVNPYSDAATANIQQIIYGGRAQPGQDEGLFVYPFYTVLMIWPLVYLPYSWAAAAIMVIMQVALILAMFSILQLVRWRPTLPFVGFALIWTLFFYPGLRGLVLGQLGLLVYLLEIVTLGALLKKQDRLAGAALALSTFKPQMGYLLIPFLLLWAIRERRWHFITSFMIVFGLLILASFLLLPSWLGDWVTQVMAYPDYTDVGSPVWVLANLAGLQPGEVSGRWVVSGSVGMLIEPVLTLACYGVMLWAWFGVLIQRKHERWLWCVVITLLVTHLVAPRTATPHFILFVLPLVFLSKHLVEQDRRIGYWKVTALWLILLVLPWVHFFATLQANFEHPTVFLPLPLFFFVWVFLTYRLWWEKAPAMQPLTSEGER